MIDEPVNLAIALASRWWRIAIQDRLRLWRVHVEGIEVTQSIQYYRAASHLTDPNDRGKDNSVTLVAGKTAWVRVYVRSGLYDEVTGVTGTLQVERWTRGGLYQGVTTLSPQPPGTLTARASMEYANERGDSEYTLNFVIPAHMFTGAMRLTARLTDGAGREYDTFSTNVSANLIQTLRVRGIMVSYDGPDTSRIPGPGDPPVRNISLPAPTLSDLMTTASGAIEAMPVQTTGSFASAGAFTWNLPLDDPAKINDDGSSGASANWNKFAAALANQRTSDGNRTDVMYYGLLPWDTPHDHTGVGGDGQGAGLSRRTYTFWHEIGHGYGFGHSPCGVPGDMPCCVDPNYPKYEPYPSASIGEFGLNISSGDVFWPLLTHDYMSYCIGIWMSLYTYKRLIGHPRLDPHQISDLGWRDYYEPWRGGEMQTRGIISITGIVRSLKEIEVTSVARVMAAGSPPGARTTLTAELVDASGRSISEGSLIRLNAQFDGDPNTPPFAFQAFLPDAGSGSALRIMHRDEEVWSRQAPSRAPEVSRLEAGVSKNGLRLRWRAETAIESPEVWAQWSTDQDKMWQGLATNLSGGEVMLDLTGLPEGEIAVRVLVHDGFFTAASEPTRVTIPPRAPDVAIMHPGDGQALFSGKTLNLWAAATDSAAQPLPDEAYRWSVDEREVGTGTELWLESPPAGEHTATVTVRWSGGEVVESVRFRTIPTALERTGARPLKQRVG